MLLGIFLLYNFNPLQHGKSAPHGVGEDWCYIKIMQKIQDALESWIIGVAEFNSNIQDAYQVVVMLLGVGQ